MSEENIEVALESFRRFDPADLTDWAILLHPDVRMTGPEGWPEQGPFIGRDANVRQFEHIYADWSEYRLENISVAKHSGDWVVLTWNLRTRGVGSGIETEVALATSMRIENGLITESHHRWNLGQALEAAGLSE